MGKLRKNEPEIYELQCTDGRKSFYGKAIVMIDGEGNKTLYSYNTKIVTKHPDGSLSKHWPDNEYQWTQTTGRHIKAFTGLNKKEYLCDFGF